MLPICCFQITSGLGYHQSSRKSYKNFCELLVHEKVKLDDFPPYNKPNIEWLIEQKYLLVNDEGYIVFLDQLLIVILRDLFTNDVIYYWKYPKRGRDIINRLEGKKIIELESSLFSRPEQEYINYLLNKSQFNNGLDLRNKYVHTQFHRDDDENLHNQNYMTLLRTFILAVIKINDEFCVADQLKNV